MTSYTLIVQTPQPITTTLSVGQGPAGTSGSAIFITDITTTGVIGQKVLSTDGKRVLSCATDTDEVTVWIGCEGGQFEYTPTADVLGVPVALSESSTKRWFTGSATVPLGSGMTTVVATSDAGATTSAAVTLLGQGPGITSVQLGGYPGVQTELKDGDQITVTVQADADATEVQIISGSTVDGITMLCTAGVATGLVTIAGGTGTLTFTARARNSFGTYGANFTSPALVLNQTAPSFSAVSTTYPAGQTAIALGQTATVSCTVSNADSYTYTATGLTVANLTTYAVAKTVEATSASYVAAGTNYTITAYRAANGATASTSALVRLATAAPTAAITTSPTGRMVSSPSGIDYEVRITPSQTLSTAPTLVAAHGTWQGSWVLVGSYWRRSLRITDAVPRGTFTFGPIALSSASLTAGDTITSGASYVVGGVSSRALTFPAFSRVVAIGTTVGDRTKTTASISGGNALTRVDSTAVQANGYYIANADASYNPNGAYLGLSDTGLAGANSSGTLQVIFEETA